jgi:hypothetical protein
VRGEVWSYSPQGTPRHLFVVIVSSDGINLSPRRWLLAAPVLPRNPDDILAVPVPGRGWVHAGILTRCYRPWLTERVDVLDTDTHEALDRALRAALDL